MKPIFAGLILFSAIGATAQTSKTVNNNQQKKLTPGKMREVILADEHQHEAKASSTHNNDAYYGVYKTPSSGPYHTTRSNYVTQHHDALLAGFGTGLSIEKGVTRYSNTPYMNSHDPNNYWVPRQPTKKKVY